MYVAYSADGEGKVVHFPTKEKLFEWVEENDFELEGDTPISDLDEVLRIFGVIGIYSDCTVKELEAYLYFRSCYE